jgi:hypothetical protein
MNKLTRRFKKKRNNKTFKGGSETNVNRPLNVDPLKEGVHAVGNVIESVNNTVGDGVGWVKDTASEAVVGTTNFFADKANYLGNSIIDAIADKVQANMPHNISEQGVDIIEKKTEKIIEAQAKIARKALYETTKIMKQELPDIANAAGTAAAAAIETIPGIGSIAAIGTLLNKSTDAAEKSLDMVNKLQDVVAESLTTIDETINKVKNVGDIPGIPDVGALSNNAIGEASQKINNGINGLKKDVSDNANFATTALNNTIESGLDNMTSPPKIRIGGGFKDFSKEKAQIGGRISESLHQFANPIGYHSILKGGKNKTNKMVKRNSNKNRKSRRVRFSL